LTIPADERIFLFLQWWEHMPGRRKSDFCRLLVRDHAAGDLMPESTARFILRCAGALRRSALSSSQEHSLLQELKRLIHLSPGFAWPGLAGTPRPGALPARPPGSRAALYDWQREALSAWREQGKKGIIKAVTGSGKTMVALEAIRAHLAEGGRAVILVPTCALLDQWKKELQEHLHIGDEQIGCAGGGSQCSPARQVVTVWVLNSAREALAGALGEVSSHVPILLVVDECHRAGSRINARIFEARYDQAMGLSATPERMGDPGYEQVLIPHLGPPVYSYDFSRALREGLIPPFDLINISIDFTPWERQEYEERCREIIRKLSILMNTYRGLRWPLCRNYHRRQCGRNFAQLAHLCLRCPHYERSDDLEESPLLFKFLYYVAEYLDDPLAKQIITLIINRKHFVNDAAGRAEAALSLLSHTPRDAKALVFSERIALAEEILKGLAGTRGDLRCGIYHSRIHGDERKQALNEFRRGKLDMLICCHALDEGLDVPSAAMGIIVSGANSIRQRVQRLGRVLRAHPGKKKSVIFNFHVKETVERRLMFTELQQDGMDSAEFHDMDITGLPSFLEEYFT